MSIANFCSSFKTKRISHCALHLGHHYRYHHPSSCKRRAPSFFIHGCVYQISTCRNCRSSLFRRLTFESTCSISAFSWECTGNSSVIYASSATVTNYVLCPILLCSGCDESTCRVHTPKAVTLHTKWRSLNPSKCNLYSDGKICGRYFILIRLSASLHVLSRNTLGSYLHNFAYSDCTQKNAVWATDIKVVCACPSNRFNRKYLFAILLWPESSSSLISILVSSHSHQSWQVMYHISPASL